MTVTARHTALADQVDAASRDARRTLRHNARRTVGARCFEAPANPWLTRQARALAAALAAGTARACPHVGPAPRVIHAAVWAPGLLVCPACVELLTPADDEDATCDRCRHRANPIHGGATAIGSILLGYGLCTRCLHIIGLDQTEDTRP